MSEKVSNISDVTGGLRLELDYLVSKGFGLSEDGSKMIEFNMEIKSTINKLIHIPSEFRSGNGSFYSLLMATGYFNMYEQISINDLNLALNESPSCILDWLGWSEDKRTSSGWYFTGNDEKGYVVGFVTEDCDSTQEVSYTKSDIACSNYIKLEIEETRMRHKSSRKEP